MKALCADPAYFIAVNVPVSTSGHVGWFVLDTAFIVPIADPAKLKEARTYGRGSNTVHPCFRVKVAPGSDGINRNLLITNQPLWLWHIVEFDSFHFGCGEYHIVDPLRPTPHSLHDPEVMARTIAEGGWTVTRYEIVAEINPPLATSIRFDAALGLVLEWDDLGKFYAYTVETRLLAEPLWTVAPGVDWPIRVNQRGLSILDDSNGSRLFRVKAEFKAPPLLGEQMAQPSP